MKSETPGRWPYEAQYLKLYDVTAPTGAPGSATTANSCQYVLGNSATVTWQAAAPDEGVVPSYRVSVTINGVTTAYITSATSLTFSGQPGQTAFVTVQSVNPSDNSMSGPISPQSTIRFISVNGDDDGDGENNSEEDLAGTNPFDSGSLFAISATTKSGNVVTIAWSSVSGRNYQVEFTSDLNTGFAPLSGVLPASGAGTNTYKDNTSGEKRFYRVRLVSAD